MIGHIKAVRQSFGFLTADDGTDVYFDLDDVTDSFDLLVGDRVTWEAVIPEPARGRRARAVSFVAAGERR